MSWIANDTHCCRKSPAIQLGHVKGRMIAIRFRRISSGFLHILVCCSVRGPSLELWGLSYPDVWGHTHPFKTTKKLAGLGDCIFLVLTALIAARPVLLLPVKKFGRCGQCWWNQSYWSGPIYSAASGSSDSRNVGTASWKLMALFLAVFIFIYLNSLRQLHKGRYKFRGKKPGRTPTVLTFSSLRCHRLKPQVSAAKGKLVIRI